MTEDNSKVNEQAENEMPDLTEMHEEHHSDKKETRKEINLLTYYQKAPFQLKLVFFCL